MSENTPTKKYLSELSDKYGNATWIRAVIQAVPYVGGSLDTLMSAQGQKWREERVKDYIDEIAKNVSGLEEKFERAISDSAEPTYDLMRTHIEQVDRTRSKSKRKHFANILLNQIESAANWDEPETASRILGSLTDAHIWILKEICSAPVCPAPFDGIRVSIIEPIPEAETKGAKFHDLSGIFTDIPVPQLRLLVIELLSSGLIKDEGVGRYGARAMEKFSPLPTANWFLSWIERGT